MMALLTRLVAGPLVEGVLGVVRRIEARKMTEAEMRAEIEKAVAGALSQAATSITAEQRQTLVAELRGENWLQRNWRPIVALAAFFSYWYVIVAVPHLVLWGWMAPPRFGERGLENLFWLVTICVGGYIGGRTLEKVAQTLRA